VEVSCADSEEWEVESFTMSLQNYRDLIVWQKAMTLAELVYALTKHFPQEEIYGRTSQVRRAAVSIPSNIAEGQARTGTAEFKNFLSIASGSRSEVETQLILAQRLGYITQPQLKEARDLANEIKRMTHSLISKLK
jgi:four helix bundle protein